MRKLLAVFLLPHFLYTKINQILKNFYAKWLKYPYSLA